MNYSLFFLLLYPAGRNEGREGGVGKWKRRREEGEGKWKRKKEEGDIILF
jgi:hypothetical protein